MSNISDIDLRVRKIISEHLNVPLMRVAPETSFFRDLGADSLAKLEIIMVIEEKFGITIYEEMSRSLQTVGDVIECVNELSGTVKRSSLVAKALRT